MSREPDANKAPVTVSRAHRMVCPACLVYEFIVTLH